MPTNRSDATDEQVAAYSQQAMETEHALSQAITLLKTRAALFANADETRQITAQVGLLQADIAKVQAELLAFLAGTINIEPPSASDVAAVTSLANQLDAMIADSALTNDVIALATTVAQNWQQTKA